MSDVKFTVQLLAAALCLIAIGYILGCTHIIRDSQAWLSEERGIVCLMVDDHVYHYVTDVQ